AGEPTRQLRGTVLDIDDANDLSSLQRATGDHGFVDREWIVTGDLGERRRADVVQHGHVNALAVRLEDAAHECSAESHCAADDRVEYGASVGGRTGDEPEDLAGRRLLLPHLGELDGQLRLRR